MQYHQSDVRFVTYRHESPRNYVNDDIIFDANNLGIPIIFCGGRQKEHVVNELGFNVDIWIDDMPMLIPSLNKLEGMVKGCKVNNDITPSRYSEEPMVIV